MVVVEEEDIHMVEMCHFSPYVANWPCRIGGQRCGGHGGSHGAPQKCGSHCHGMRLGRDGWHPVIVVLQQVEG